jgi:sugar phosphate isomerase/epimerase
LRDLEIGLAWGTLHRAGLVEFIDLAARHGFPTLAVPPHIYEAALAAGETPRSLRRRLADGGVRVRVIDCIAAGMPGMPPGETVVDSQPIRQYDAAECLAIADALEAPVINISLYNSKPVPVAEMAEAVGDVCRLAGSGHSIVIEFYPESGITDLAAADAIARACGEGNCGVMLDVWHLARSGGGVAQVAALAAGAIGALQLSDRIEPPTGTPYVPMSGRRLPGEGALPLGALVAAALANSPGITAEIEVFSAELAALPLAMAGARTAAAVRAWRESLACEG